MCSPGNPLEHCRRPDPYRRQPILDARGQVYGYELFFRATREATTFVEPGHASARLISDVVTGPGFDALSDGKRVFLNMSADVLLADVSGLFDPERAWARTVTQAAGKAA